MLSVANIVVGALETNCYIISAPNLQALIIDPGAEAETTIKIIKSRRLMVRGYLITHGHMDHISALEPLWAHIQAPVVMHGLDAKWAFGAANQMPPYYPIPRRPALIEHLLKGGEIFEGRVGQFASAQPPGEAGPCPTEPNGGTTPLAWQAGCLPRLERGPALPRSKFLCMKEGDFHYQAIATPGHSPGSVCFYFPDENIIFSGDTLFQDSIGRTDLPGGNMEQLNKSLKILAGLPPQTRVYPGHGPETTIGREIESNPFLNSAHSAPRR